MDVISLFRSVCPDFEPYRFVTQFYDRILALSFLLPIRVNTTYLSSRLNPLLTAGNDSCSHWLGHDFFFSKG
jgi:hypothetical protein